MEIHRNERRCVVENNRAERSITSYTIYNNIINNPDYSFQDWMKHIDNEDLEHRAVCAFVSYAPIDEVYFILTRNIVKRFYWKKF